MDLHIKNQTFLVCGVTSGLGKATAEHLIAEGAKAIGIARTEQSLTQMAKQHSDSLIPIVADITNTENIKQIIEQSITANISGVFINSGGPPAKKFEETNLSDWDNAYNHLLKWKVTLIQGLLPHFKSLKYGRFVFLESSSVKQPIDNLVLSTSLRLSVVGLMKTLSQELAGSGITFNLIAPGSHDTPAIDRLISKKSEEQNIGFEDAKNAFIQNQPTKTLGNPKHLGSLATWLLSPLSEFVNGQVYAIEGGAVKSTL
ncbi:SDR family oxidoreductase [Labilibacter sediminis]|nr:SDR family oxidoreductase [Labilibacter sediminis]